MAMEADSVETPTLDTETARIRGIMNKLAPGYDRQISFYEKLLFGGAREWPAPGRTGTCWRSPSGRDAISRTTRGT
jgi:hypothetical protein